MPRLLAAHVLVMFIHSYRCVTVPLPDVQLYFSDKIIRKEINLIYFLLYLSDCWWNDMVY